MSPKMRDRMILGAVVAVFAGALVLGAVVDMDHSVMFAGERSGAGTDGSAVDTSAVSAPDDGAGYKIGDEITMGRYGGEGIVWTVKDKSSDGVLLISKYVIDAKPLHDKFEKITWEDCTLRSWLNGEFISESFTDEEQSRILTAALVNNDNPINGIDGGNDTEDRVFLLSIDEAYKYFETNSDRQAAPTEYAKSNGVFIDGDGMCYWRLRSPGRIINYSAFVYVMGMVNEDGFEVHYKYYGLRPAMWIKGE